MEEKREQNFPFTDLKENANTLIFPNLESGNIAYKLMQEFDDVEAIGPILIGMKKPVHILQLGCSVREIVNMKSAMKHLLNASDIDSIVMTSALSPDRLVWDAVHTGASYSAAIPRSSS